jgi:hypothetical protein
LSFKKIKYKQSIFYEHLEAWRNKWRNKMNSTKKFLAILKGDKKLLGIFGGILLDGAILVGIIIAACVWYLS